MAPRDAALHRRRRRSELGSHTLPHRRHRRVRRNRGSGLRLRQRNRLASCWITAAVASAAPGRPPNRAGHPAIGRAAVAAARFARRNRGRAGSATPPPAPLAGVDELVALPTATIFLDA